MRCQYVMVCVQTCRARDTKQKLPYLSCWVSFKKNIAVGHRNSNCPATGVTGRGCLQTCWNALDQGQGIQGHGEKCDHWPHVTHIFQESEMSSWQAIPWAAAIQITDFDENHFSSLLLRTAPGPWSHRFLRRVRGPAYSAFLVSLRVEQWVEQEQGFGACYLGLSSSLTASTLEMPCKGAVTFLICDAWIIMPALDGWCEWW